jgi:D-alanyl-D-alanine carboxypeptidase (penicillin-binding protein 5/6)
MVVCPQFPAIIRALRACRDPPLMIRFVAAAFALLSFTASAATPVPDAPQLPARSYVLYDYDSGQVLAAKEPELRVEPASLTKVMLSYVAFDELRQGRVKPEDLALVSEKAWRQGYDSKESRMFIEVGKRVTVQDLLHGIVVQSGNDASVALAEHLAGTEATCADLMNRYAQKLGMTDTRFANATGVPAEGQYTTARDMALLGHALVRDFPEEYALFKQRDFTFNKIRQPNRNRLLARDPSVDGIKTGHAEAAGYHLLASAVRDGRRLVTVVLGSAGEEERAQQTLALLNYGFRFFETATVAEAQKPVLTIRAWKGVNKELALGLAAPLVVSLPRGGRERLELKPEAGAPVHAPVAAGQALGTLKVVLDGKVLREEPLVALSALPEGNLWRRVTDGVQLWIQDL